MLYSVALHRFLRWRQPGYDPAVHIGGVLYLFVRGMSGPDTPLVDGQPCGVFGWRPPVGLITGLSDLLDGEPDADVGPAVRRDRGARRQRAARPTRCRARSSSRTTLSTCGWRWARPGCSATSTRRGVLTAADVHVAARLAQLGRRARRARSRLAVALAVRGVRSGSVCVDLAQVATPVGAGRPGAAVAGRRRWLAAVLASPLVGAGKPLRWEYGLLYLDRYRRQEEQVRRDLLARGRPAAAVGRRRRAGRRTAPAVPRRGRRAAAARGRRSPPPGGRRCSAAGPAPARPPPSPGCWRCCWTSRARRCGWRWPRRPARPPPGCRRPCRREARTFAAGPARPADADRVHPAPAARLGPRRRHHGSGTTGTTGCRSTWWWSTRRRWCR